VGLNAVKRIHYSLNKICLSLSKKMASWVMKLTLCPGFLSSVNLSSSDIVLYLICFVILLFRVTDLLDAH
jgi:hypothetical protein